MDLPPPETTPRETVSDEIGTPSCVAAIPSRTCFADAAPARTLGPACVIDELPTVLPVSGVTFESASANVSWLRSMSSSSPAIISRPFGVP
jgi:hypothetical protein